MRRKLIKQGNQSYTVTVPIKWIREHSLKDNAELEVNSENSSITFSLPKDVERHISKVEINLNGYGEKSIKNILYQKYRKGYDQISLTFQEEEQLSIIKKVVHKTILGFEIVEIKNNICTIQNISEPSKEKFSVILRKIFITIKEEGKEIMQDIQDNNKNKLKTREESKHMIDTYTNFCRRLIIKEKIEGQKNSYSLMAIVSQLSLIYHSYFYMYKYYCENNNVKLCNKTKEVITLLDKMFNLFYESFYQKDLKKANEIAILKEQLVENDIYNTFRITSGNENIILYHCGEIVRLIQMASTNIYGLT